MSGICMYGICPADVWFRQTADTSDKSSSGDVRLIEALNSEIIHLKTMVSEERDDHRTVGSSFLCVVPLLNMSTP